MAYDVPADLLYLPTHQWVRINGDKGEIGITDYAQKAMGGITWVELPQAGDKIEMNVPFGSVESVKAISDVLSPVSGEVLEINEKLEDAPELCNSDPYHEGWLIRVRITGKSPQLLSPDDYSRLCDEQ